MLDIARVRELLGPAAEGPTDAEIEQISAYLDRLTAVLIKWHQRGCPRPPDYRESKTKNVSPSAIATGDDHDVRVGPGHMTYVAITAEKGIRSYEAPSGLQDIEDFV